MASCSSGSYNKKDLVCQLGKTLNLVKNGGCDLSSPEGVFHNFLKCDLYISGTFQNN